jgi:thiol-disulfide isomerase/thioredoxin
MFDWDLWIAAEGDPLPQRISVDMSKWLKEVAAQNPGGNAPQKVELASYFHDWKIGTEPTDEQFAFTVPEGAEKVDSFFPDGRGMGGDRPSPLLGKAAPALELDLLEGGTFSLASHQGKQVVILDFWATWCGPCVAAMPLVAEVAEAYKDKGVVVYAVNQQEEPEDIKAFFEDKEFKATVALDAAGDAATKFGVEGIPMLVMVGLDGTVQAVHVGFDPDLKKVLSKDLDKLLAGEKLVDKPAEEKPADEKGSDAPPAPEAANDKDKPADAEKPADSGDKPAEGDTPFGGSN